jgi:hypothetical protein
MNINNNIMCITIGRYFGLLICTAIFVLNGCTTTMCGGPTANNKSGIRYALPAPHIFMNPQPDGTVTVEVKYLPDPNNTYTLSIDSYFSSATFDVQMNNGMLTKLSLDTDSSAIPNKAVTTANEIQKQIITDIQKEKDDKKAKEDANKAAIKAAADAVQVQNDKIALLKGKQRFYEANPDASTPALQNELKLQISQEEITLRQLKSRLRLTQSGDSAANNPTDAFLDPTSDNASLQNAYGPVIFRVLPTDNGGVRLVALENQGTYQTSNSAQPVTPQPSLPSLTFTPTEAIVKAGDKDRDIVVTFTQSLKAIDKERTRLVRPSDGTGAPPVLPGDKMAINIGGPEKKQIRLVLPNDVTKGEYRLDVTLQVEGNDAPQMKSIPIHWLVE